MSAVSDLTPWCETGHTVVLHQLKSRGTAEHRYLTPFVGQRGLVVETGRTRERKGQIFVQFEKPRKETLWVKRSECAPTHTPTTQSQRRRWREREW